MSGSATTRYTRASARGRARLTTTPRKEGRAAVIPGGRAHRPTAGVLAEHDACRGVGGPKRVSLMRALVRPARRQTAAQRALIGEQSSPAHPQRVGLRTPRARFAAGLTGGALMLRREGVPHRVWSRARSAEGAEEGRNGFDLSVSTRPGGSEQGNFPQD